MRLLFLGDMVGRTGRTAVTDALPRLRKDLDLDFVIPDLAGVVFKRLEFSSDFVSGVGVEHGGVFGVQGSGFRVLKF